MRERLSLSVERGTAVYLSRRAAVETAGNVSALVDRLVRQVELGEAIQSEARWYAEHPGEAEAAEAERYAA